MYVADRLIASVCELDYPQELLEIQVLDDSTDETSDIAELAVRRHAGRGFDINYLHRDGSHGVQGGCARGRPQTRHRAVHRHFRRGLHPAARLPEADAAVFRARIRRSAMVQARWGHINQDYSLLTKIQSILLDAHFVLEHGGRNRAGCFFNFNGTAGIWRREAIPDAGGWQHDTLTEDLRPELPRAAPRLAVHLPAGSRVAGRSAGGDELVQVAAASLGERVDPDLHEADAGDPAVESAMAGEGGGLLPPLGELQLPAHVGAVDPHVPGNVRALQHGMDGDAADRHPAVRRGDARRSAISTWWRSGSCTRTGRCA